MARRMAMLDRTETGRDAKGYSVERGKKLSGPAGAMERCGAAGSCLGLAEGATAFANPNIART